MKRMEAWQHSSVAADSAVTPTPLHKDEYHQTIRTNKGKGIERINSVYRDRN